MIESIGINGEQRSDPVERAHRDWSGHDRGDVAVEHGEIGGGRMLIDASLEPSIELRKQRVGSGAPLLRTPCLARPYFGRSPERPAQNSNGDVGHLHDAITELAIDL